jgi:hypothetical protein
LRVQLIGGSDRLLPMLPRCISDRAKDALTRLGTESSDIKLH